MFDNKYRYLAALMRNERRSLDELLWRQTTRLRTLLAHSWHHVPFYRENLKKVGFHPRDFRTLDDLKRLPIIGKEDFYRRSPADYTDRRIPWPKALVPVKTSGSSGQALKFYIDLRYDQFRKAQFLRPYMTNGQRPIDRIASFTGRPHRRKRIFEHLGLLREKQIAADLDPEIQLAMLRQFKPAVVRGYPSVLALIGARIREQGPLPHMPKRVFTDSELLTAGMRQSIETAFGCRVLDIYGTMETDNIAYECNHHRGYHMAIDSVVMEFVKDGRAVSPGETGEIVCTVLENFAMPFIRYRLNDSACFSAEKCPCGRTFPLMRELHGRTHDYVVKAEGRRMSSTSLLSEMDRHAGNIAAFQIVQEDIDRFSLYLVPGRHYDAAVGDRIRSGLGKRLPGAEILITVTERLRRDASGKFMPFKSLVRNDKAGTKPRRHES